MKNIYKIALTCFIALFLVGCKKEEFKATSLETITVTKKLTADDTDYSSGYRTSENIYFLYSSSSDNFVKENIEEETLKLINDDFNDSKRKLCVNKKPRVVLCYLVFVKNNFDTTSYEKYVQKEDFNEKDSTESQKIMTIMLNFDEGTDIVRWIIGQVDSNNINK